MDYLKEKTKDELLEIILKQAALNSDYVLTLLKYKQQEEQLKEIMHSLKKDLRETRQELEELLDEVFEMESLGNVEEEKEFAAKLEFIENGEVVERADGSNDYVPAKEMEKQIAVSYKSHYHFLQNGQRKIINKTDDLFDFSQFEILNLSSWKTQNEEELLDQIELFLQGKCFVREGFENGDIFAFSIEGDTARRILTFTARKQDGVELAKKLNLLK